ncbi:carboxypeptidase-like regulatory domain-containing protein [Puia sp. P3]|uniref:carboxypeptidase-like regulatory domain-containing protein n=1 Tax=Puia sp. P3 TaxID=3423952 RepID=UPI003D67DC87
MRKLMLIILTVCLSTAAIAQEVSGTVLDESQKPVSGATVGIRKAADPSGKAAAQSSGKSADTSILKYTTTDPTGKYSFQSIPAGTYTIQLSHIGYADRRSAPFQSTETQQSPPSNWAKRQEA